MATIVFQLEVGQGLQVGPEIAVTIVRIKRNAVRIVIEAPNTLSVYRGEFADAIVLLQQSRLAE